MAVIQAVFKHCDGATLAWHPQSLADEENFSYHLRCLVTLEAKYWEDRENIVVDWGDPAQKLDAQALALACRNGSPRALFGRSWLHYHRPSHRMTMGIDLLGLFPILIAPLERTTYIGSDALALAQLLGSAAQPASQSLIQLLAYGQLLGEQATLENAWHLQAGSVCTFNHNGTYHVYNSSPFVLPTSSSSEDDAVDSLVAAMDRRLQNDPGALLPLTGGTASRLLLAAAQAAGHRPSTCCFAPPGSAEFEIANTLADAAGVDFHSVETIPRQFSAIQANIAQLGGGEVPVLRGCGLLSPELIARSRGTTLITTTGAKVFQEPYYDNPGNELLSATAFKQPSLKTARRYAEDSFNKYLEPFLNAWPDLRGPLQEGIANRIEVYQSSAADASRYLDSIYLGEYVRRAEVSVQQLFARDYARSHPFLEPEVIHHMAGLSLSQRMKGRFLRRAVAKLSPKLAEVNWDKTMRPLSESLRWEERYLGLASYLGIMPTSDAEQPVCNQEVIGWLNSQSEHNSNLWHALREQGLGDGEIAAGLPRLYSGPLRLHALSAVASHNGWNDYLNKRRTVLAA